MMNQKTKRVFIGVKISPEIGGFCFGLQSKLRSLSTEAEWVNTEDFHLTLVSPWQMQVENEERVKHRFGEILKEVKPFTIRLKRLDFGPSHKNPNLIWVITTCSPEFLNLKRKLDSLLGRKEEQKFLPHITLARLSETQKQEWNGKNIEEDLEMLMEVNSMELFECLLNEEAKYSVLESFTLEK